MTEYKDNETYERDKARVIDAIARGIPIENCFMGAYGMAADLLRQSKWVGNETEPIKPLPVVRDKCGKLIRDYDELDWLVKINEEYHEATVQIILEDTTRAAEELQDIITVCTSMLQWLGFDEHARDELTKQVNEKNRQRGYFEEN